MTTDVVSTNVNKVNLATNMDICQHEMQIIP